MSDAAAPQDLEDVLASIRRLVSRNEQAAADALMLTTEQRVAKFLAVEDAEEVVDEPQASKQSAPALERQPETVAQPADVVAPVFTSARDGDQNRFSNASSPAVEQVAPSVAEAIQDAKGEDEAVQVDTQAESEAPSPNAVGADEPAVDAPVERSATQDVPQDQSDDPARVSAAAIEIKALEETMNQLRAEISPEPFEAAKPESASDLDFPELPELDHPVPAPIDEAMLQEVVSDLIREELRGALGQKITRNVRKLVRQEIQRALTTPTMD